ncbi:MAG TPA: hypothetical protein VN887_16670 [Candidatus Angelobacter sp.]|nr:hypothetical protein [Candidatus Angelobacter sp.]
MDMRSCVYALRPAVFLLFESFSDGTQKAQHCEVLLTPGGFFCQNQRIQTQEFEFPKREFRHDALTIHGRETTDSGNIAEAIQFSKISLQIGILQITETISRHFQRQFVRGQAMRWMQVSDDGFDAPDVLFTERAANIQIKGCHGNSVMNGTDTADHNEVKAAAFQADEQCLVILRHEQSWLPEQLIKNQSLAGAPPTVAREST